MKQAAKSEKQKEARTVSGSQLEAARRPVAKQFHPALDAFLRDIGELAAAIVLEKHLTERANAVAARSREKENAAAACKEQGNTGSIACHQVTEKRRANPVDPTSSQGKAETPLADPKAR